jgi:hypothetical protein
MVIKKYNVEKLDFNLYTGTGVDQRSYKDSLSNRIFAKLIRQEP